MSEGGVGNCDMVAPFGWLVTSWNRAGCGRGCVPGRSTAAAAAAVGWGPPGRNRLWTWRAGQWPTLGGRRAGPADEAAEVQQQSSRRNPAARAGRAGAAWAAGNRCPHPRSWRRRGRARGGAHPRRQDCLPDCRQGPSWATPGSPAAAGAGRCLRRWSCRRGCAICCGGDAVEAAVASPVYTGAPGTVMLMVTLAIASGSFGFNGAFIDRMSSTSALGVSCQGWWSRWQRPFTCTSRRSARSWTRPALMAANSRL